MPGPADWSHEGIDYAVSHGLFVGTSDTTFSPASAMTRAMLVSVLWRMEGEPAHTDRNPFTDVGREWYTDGVLWAAEHDIVAGIGDGRFDPDGDVTREQIAAILCRYTLWKGRSADARADLRVFPDARDVSGWAYDSLAWANAEDLISGCMIGSISYLKPLDNATRAQVAAILMRYQQSIGA
ncbi:MAG: S-layer homology domain-containing protein [Oscillospiraceae bacterium]